MLGSQIRIHSTDQAMSALSQRAAWRTYRMKTEIRYAKDFLDASSDQRNTRYLADAAGILLGLEAEPCFENPCVGGSIPPRATKNTPCTTPIHRDWRCRFWTSQASPPVNVHFAHPSIQHGKLMCPGRVRSTKHRSRNSREGSSAQCGCDIHAADRRENSVGEPGSSMRANHWSDKRPVRSARIADNRDGLSVPRVAASRRPTAA